MHSFVCVRASKFFVPSAITFRPIHRFQLRACIRFCRASRHNTQVQSMENKSRLDSSRVWRLSNGGQRLRRGRQFLASISTAARCHSREYLPYSYIVRGFMTITPSYGIIHCFSPKTWFDFQLRARHGSYPR